MNRYMKKRESDKLYEFYKSNKKYFSLMAETHGADYYDSILRLLRYTKISPIGKNILDIGCGSGTLVKVLKDKYGRNIKATGIDISRLGNSEKYLHFIQGSAMNLPFKDKSFDLIFITDVLEHITKPRLALKEARRVLKDGGVLIIRTPNYSHPIIFGFRPVDSLKEILNHYLGLSKGLDTLPALSYDLSDEYLGGDSDAIVGIKYSDLLAELKRLRLNLLASETWGGGNRRNRLVRILNQLPAVSLLGSSITLAASS